MPGATSFRRPSVDNATPLRSGRRGSDADNVSPNIQARRRRIVSAIEPRTRNFGEKHYPTKELDSPNGLLLQDEDEFSMDYLAKLIREKKQLECFPKYFENVERLLNNEITRVREVLFNTDFLSDGLELPDPEGDIITVTEKIYVPVHEYPEFNFVGRILGPRGMTSKQLEQETGCKIMVRGRGSMKDKRKEEANRGRPNWEHLDDDLHVLIQCEDTENRCRARLQAATQHIRRLLVPAPEGTDELKRKQLMELAIMNGTYRSSTAKSPSPRDLTHTPTRFQYHNSTYGLSPSSPRSSSISPRNRGQHSNSDIFLNSTLNSTGGLDYGALSSLLSCPGLLSTPGMLDALSVTLNEPMLPGMHQNPFDMSALNHFDMDTFGQLDKEHGSRGSISSSDSP